jgi:FixJ family two-component response regulator
LQVLFATLSPREREVMALVVTGRMNKQVAAEIGVAETTLKMHRRNILKKWLPNRLPIWRGWPRRSD